MTDATGFRRSSACHSGSCVEVAIGDGVVAVRDAKDSARRELRFSTDQWRTFVAAVKAGEFEPAGPISRPGSSGRAAP